MTEKILNHFTFLSFSEHFWELPTSWQVEFFPQFEQELQTAAPCVHMYQISPLRADQDMLVWTALPVDEADASQAFFDRLGRVINRHRRIVLPHLALWGYTKPSTYARGTPTQEVDPMSSQRAPYLVFYPFVKTIDWYLLGKDTRQGMMNEHIRIGHQYPEIKQLLLYSFGLQDQEFIVVYETEDLSHFSDLVHEMRSAEVRRYTERDTPIYTALHRTASQLAELFSSPQEVH